MLKRTLSAVAAATHPNPTDYSLAIVERLRSEERLRLQLVLSKPMTVAEAAYETGFSRATVTKLFADKKGVIILNRPETLHKRKHRSIRIPRKVFERVIGELTN